MVSPVIPYPSPVLGVFGSRMDTVIFSIQTEETGHPLFYSLYFLECRTYPTCPRSTTYFLTFQKCYLRPATNRCLSSMLAVAFRLFFLLFPFDAVGLHHGLWVNLPLPDGR